MEKGLEQVNKRVDDAQARLDTKVSEIERTAADERAARERADQEFGARMEDIALGSFDLNWAGAILVIVGSFFSTFPVGVGDVVLKLKPPLIALTGVQQPIKYCDVRSYMPRFHAGFGLRSRAPRTAARCGAASRLAVAATLLGALACNDSASAPPDPRGIRKVLVGVQADPTTLHAAGEFVLRLVPLDGKGDPVLSDGLEIAPKVTAPTTQNLPPIATAVQRPDSRPLAAAVSIDDSKSMDRNDPTNQRAQAAQLFWTEVLSARSDNQVALVAFGGEQPTAPFTRTVLLQSWTSDQSVLASAVTQLTGSGPTYLYQSTAEVAPWVTATRPAASYRHALLLVTDGLPTDSLQADAAIQAAVGAGIAVFTVGLGPASDESGSIDTRAVERLRTLANATGGVYAGVENNAVLSTTFQSVGKLTTQGALLVTVRMTPAPAAGTAIKGAVRVGNPYGSASADWSFTAP